MRPCAEARSALRSCCTAPLAPHPDIDDFYRAKDPKPLLFCHFAAGHGGDAGYNEVCDAAGWKKLQRTLQDGLAEYNETNAGEGLGGSPSFPLRLTRKLQDATPRSVLS